MMVIMVEGGAVEVMVRRREGMEKVVEEMPGLVVSWSVALFGDWESWRGEGGERKEKGKGMEGHNWALKLTVEFG